MPIGPWGSFDECVAANQDKSSPEGFCAWLEHKLTGSWPSQASKLTPEALATFDTQINIALSEVLKTFRFQESRSVRGVEVFAIGKWVDSIGRTREWTRGDLREMVEAFTPGSVPLKIGHTSPAFNLKIAQALGVPVEMLTGEQGKGQMALGQIKKLALKGNKLIADFEGVPGPLAEMIEAGNYSTVSSEIEFGGERPRLAAVALLGVEKPAVGSLAGLEAARMFGRGRVFSFSHISSVGLKGQAHGEIKEGALEQFTRDSLIKDIAGMFQEGSADALTAIAVALGLDPATATLANVLKAIEGLKTGGGMPPEGMETKAEHSKMRADFAALTATVERQAKTIAQYEHDRLVAKFTKLAEGWKAIPGKPSDIGAKLAETEEKAGEEVVGLVVAQFQAANQAAVDAGVLKAVGRSKIEGTEPTDPFEREVQARATTEKLSFNKALASLSLERPAEFAAYRRRQSGNGS